MKIKKFRYSIGLDAGKITGLAIFDSEKQELTTILSANFLEAIDYIKNLDAVTHKVIVEIPGTFVYARNDAHQGKTRDRMVHNVGGNRREAVLLADMLEMLGYHVERVPPVKEKKWNEKEFKMYLKCDKRTNQHVRDAARLAYYHSNFSTGR